jgi:hypothetical protein
MSFEHFYAAYLLHDVDNRDALIHFRITTRGDNSVDNCHPFQIGCGALIHNGTITGLGTPGKGKSDTQLFAEMIHGFDLATLTRLSPMIEAYLDGDRMAVMTHAGEFLLFNQEKWVEDNGVWYSNDTYKESWGLWTNDFNELRLRCQPVIADSPSYEWDKGNLYIEHTDGYMYRDFDLEEAVYDALFTDYGVVNVNDIDEDTLDDLTYQFITASSENETCLTSTLPRTAPPTVTPIDSWLRTSTDRTRTPSTSTASSPISTANSSATPIRATR